MPASPTTLRHRATSELTSRLNSAPLTSGRRSRSLSQIALIAGVCNAVLISRVIRATSADDVPAGANTPYHVETQSPAVRLRPRSARPAGPDALRGGYGEAADAYGGTAGRRCRGRRTSLAHLPESLTRAATKASGTNAHLARHLSSCRDKT